MYTTQSKMISRAIWVEKKHVWKINLQKNGVRKSFYSSVPGDKGRKICAQNATSWLSGACPFSVSERTTVDTVFERYLQDKALETTNIYTIRNRYNNHIKPIIGKVPVMLLTKQDLKRVIYTAYRKHNLSQKSLKNIRGDLSGFCNYLDCADIRNDLRTSNIKIPSNAKKGQKQALDVSSLNILFTESQVPYNGTICQDSLIYAYRFQVVTGLRPGELMGLEWGDIDNDYIHIRRAINAKGITTNGKNEFAARDFPQTRYTRMLLESQQVYRVTPLDPHERVFGSTGQLCYRKRWGINYSDTFEESGSLPPDSKQGDRNDLRTLYALIASGADNAQILGEHPEYLRDISHIDRTRQTILEEKYRNVFRQMTVTYIFGPTGTGKTRSVKEGCGYSNCYAVSDYHHPFDGYRGQKVMLFDEFHSSLPLNSMLQYLDGYPLELPCRYANKQACYTEAYIISNLPLEKQYVSEQHEKPEAWDALLRRINCVRVFDLDGSHKDYTVHEYFHPCTTPTFEQIEIDDCPF